jgi:hypothetical protein
LTAKLDIQTQKESRKLMSCPCCGAQITLGVRDCLCGARFVGPPLDDEPIKVRRFGPTMTAVLLFVLAVAATLIITKWLAVTVVIPMWYAARAMRLARRDPEWYGGFKVAATTLTLAIVGGTVAASYGIISVPRFLENRRAGRIAATEAVIYHMASQLDEYRNTYGDYPKDTQAVKKVLTESVPVDYWGKSISYASKPADIADTAITRTGISYKNFELRSAGPDGIPNTDDDIIMRDGVFFTNAEIKKQPAIRNSSDR